jgi:hypothetical protein
MLIVPALASGATGPGRSPRTDADRRSVRVRLSVVSWRAFCLSVVFSVTNR